MEVTLEFGQPAEATADALIVPVGSGRDAPAWSPLAKELDAALSGELLQSGGRRALQRQVRDHAGRSHSGADSESAHYPRRPRAG